MSRGNSGSRKAKLIKRPLKALTDKENFKPEWSVHGSNISRLHTPIQAKRVSYKRTSAMTEHRPKADIEELATDLVSPVRCIGKKATSRNNGHNLLAVTCKLDQKGDKLDKSYGNKTLSSVYLKQ